MLNVTAAFVNGSRRHVGHSDHGSEPIADGSTSPSPAANLPISSKTADLLTGVVGAKDQFTIRRLRDSLLKNYDTITNYEAMDAIDAPGLKSLQMLGGADPCPLISDLSAKSIQRECCDKESFLPHQVCGFTVEGLIGTFVVINDKRAGFDPARDAVLFLAGFTPNDTDMIHVY